MKHSALSVLSVVMFAATFVVGLVALFANGLFFRVLFVPVVFAGVYAAVCLLFDIAHDLRR